MPSDYAYSSLDGIPLKISFPLFGSYLYISLSAWYSKHLYYTLMCLLLLKSFITDSILGFEANPFERWSFNKAEIIIQTVWLFS
jgi:hypothetical protein